jgi:hypothetical protein
VGPCVILSTVVTAGTRIVADFALAAILFIRDGVNVLMRNVDQDDSSRTA